MEMNIMAAFKAERADTRATEKKYNADIIKVWTWSTETPCVTGWFSGDIKLRNYGSESTFGHDMMIKEYSRKNSQCR